MSDKENQPPVEEGRSQKSPCEITYFVGDQSSQGTSMHFNDRGILIMCPQPAPLNTKLRMILQFPGFRNPIELNGEVVWTNIHGPADTLSPRAMGVKFLNIERDVERLLAELASQFESLGSIYSCYFT